MDRFQLKMTMFALSAVPVDGQWTLLARRLRRRPNNGPTLVQCLVFAGSLSVVLQTNHTFK